MAVLEQNAASDETLTEKQAFADLLEWSASRPAWQRDALRRLVQNGKLDDKDIDELVTLCLNPSLQSEPISAAHVSSQRVIGEPITLLRIEKPVGINALAPNQTLEFGKGGLSIVYGDNGSGKSGYVRVLKHACRSRDRNRDKILRNVEDATATPQSANIVFMRGSAQDEHPWTPEEQRRNKGTCENSMNIRRDALEARVLNALRHNLMQPELFKEFCEEFTREMNRLRMEGRATIDTAMAEKKKIERELEKILDLYLKDALSVDMVKERSKRLEARKKELEAILAEAEEPPPLLHPNMAYHYRAQVEDLYAALQEDSEARRISSPSSISKSSVSSSSTPMP